MKNKSTPINRSIKTAKKRRINIPSKTKSLLQKEINSICPFCPSEDVDHFEIHHIDEDPSNNEIVNLLMLCPTCHSKITKGDISNESVFAKKAILSKVRGLNNLTFLFASKDNFQKAMEKQLSQFDSPYYIELKEHWNSHSLISDCPFLHAVIKEGLAKSIEYGLLPLISDFVSKHLYYDKESKYIYNQPHIYMHNRKDEGYNLPVFYHIRFIAILYATAIRNKADIDTIAHRYKNMQSIYSAMIAGMVDNLDPDEVDNSKEYPTNYHWLMGEIFHSTNNWLSQFNEKEYFVKSFSYVDFIPFSLSLCLSELYKAEKKKKIDKKFVISQCYYGILTEYFSPLMNDTLKTSIEKNIISEIPDHLIEPILDFSLDEKFAIDYENFCNNRFGFLHDREQKILNRLRKFLIAKNKLNI